MEREWNFSFLSESSGIFGENILPRYFKNHQTSLSRFSELLSIIIIILYVFTTWVNIAIILINFIYHSRIEKLICIWKTMRITIIKGIQLMKSLINISSPWLSRFKLISVATFVSTQRALQNIIIRDDKDDYHCGTFLYHKTTPEMITLVKGETEKFKVKLSLFGCSHHQTRRIIISVNQQ